MNTLPSGTITFLFTDIEGSTRLWETFPEAMAVALARHDILLREQFKTHGGYVFKTAGDAFCAAFPAAPAALAAALAIQRALRDEPWGATGPLRVRLALHTGVVELRGEDYIGPPVNRTARLLAAGHGGQTLLSLATEELIRDQLPDGATLRDLGERRLKDLVRPEHVFQLLAPGLPADFPSLKSLDVLPNNLPVQLTSFVGREKEVAEVKVRLKSSAGPATRLLTLSGVGGTGKTRLALQVAADLLEAYLDGVWLVELAALTDPELLPRTICLALGVRESAGRSDGDTLTDYIRDRQLLLVLDNCEHLIAACAQWAETLLHAGPRLQILATSREALGIPGETIFHVPSLSRPNPDVLLPPETLTQYDAVRLFVDRAVAAAPDFVVDQHNAAAVARICYRLDGIPLALELAAARVKMLHVEQVAERLDDRYRLLTGGSRAALPRQQTLQALIDWSYDLLSAPERKVLRRLTVFSGGLTLEAAESVCADPPETGAQADGVDAFALLDLLTQLVNKSLVLTEQSPSGEMRYRLLETIRQYSRDKLLESGESERLRDRHQAYFLQLAENTAAQFFGSGQLNWLGRMEADMDNLRAALEWTTVRDPVAGLRLAGSLMPLWWIRGYWMEGRAWLSQLLALAGTTAPTAVHAQALWAASWLERMQGGRKTSDLTIELAKQSLALYRELSDARGAALALRTLGFVAFDQYEVEQALAYFQEGLALFQSINDQWGIGEMLSMLGLITNFYKHDLAQSAQLLQACLAARRACGDKVGLGWTLWELSLLEIDEARQQELLTECQALFRETGEKWGLAVVLSNQVYTLMYSGRYGEAMACGEESVALYRTVGDYNGERGVLRGLGAAHRCLGHYDRAQKLQEQSLALILDDETDEEADTDYELGQLAQVRGDYAQAKHWLAKTLAVVEKAGGYLPIWCAAWAGRWLAEQGQAAPAARLFGATETLLAKIHQGMIALDREAYTQAVTSLRARLSAEVFAAEFETGRTLELGQTLQYASEILAQTPG